MHLINPLIIENPSVVNIHESQVLCLTYVCAWSPLEAPSFYLKTQPHPTTCLHLLGLLPVSASAPKEQNAELGQAGGSALGFSELGITIFTKQQ